MKGLVLRTTGSWYRVQADDATYDCRLRGNFRIKGSKQTNPIAVGDWVDFDLQDDGTGLVTFIHDRRNYIVRRSVNLSKQTHVIAANIDRLCIVATLGFPRTSTGFIDRLLATAEAYHIPAVLVFNKTDLYDEELGSIQQELTDLYQSAGYPVFAVSALKGTGIDELRKYVAGGISLFSGHSGVGKSALLNALDPTLDLRVGKVSDWSLKGTHTTTFAELHPFAGGYLIDSPGVKEFALVDFKPDELGHFFPDIRRHLHDCYFANCTHRHEPKCAVKAAVEQGLIAEERYLNYLAILDTLNEERRPR